MKRFCFNKLFTRSRLLLKVVAILSLGIISLNSYAVIPVIDYTAIAKLTSEIGQMKEQYEELKQQYEAVTGHYGWGNWENTAEDLTQSHEWAAGDWASALKGMAGGNPERYQELLGQYKEEHVAMSTDDYAKGSDKQLAKSYGSQVKTNQASATTATYEFNDINKHLKMLYQLGQSIEDEEKNNNLKAALDLNSRIEVEIGYISVEELRMQTVLDQQMAQGSASRIALENEAAQYNQAGE